MKFSPSIWRYVVNIKLAVKISSILMAFLKDINFTVTFHRILDGAISEHFLPIV